METEEATLVSLDDLDLPAEVPHFTLSEEPSIEKAKTGLILYASLLTRAPDLFLWGSIEQKMRLISFFAPHSLILKHLSLGVSNDRDNDELPDVCYHCFGFFGWTRCGRVRERCPDCIRLGKGFRFLWSNVQYEFGRLAPLSCNTEGLFSQIVAKYYSPNATKKEKEWQIMIPLL